MHDHVIIFSSKNVCMASVCVSCILQADEMDLGKV